MRALPVVALLALTTPAYAEGFAEIFGGMAIPVADSDYTDYVESSPKLGLRVGGLSGNAGGALSLDWTPVNTDNQGFSGPLGSADVSANRFRILATGIVEAKVGPKLYARARLGIGIDITHVNVKVTLLGNTSEGTDTDTGLALEPGGGLWFQLGGVAIGGELGLPIGFHGNHSNDEITLNDYTSMDVDILFGARFTSK
jgi:hypothetical protein